VNEANAEPGLKVYPNPASRFINLKSGSEGEITISDIRGSIIGVYNVPEGVTRIPVVTLANGIYFISFSSDKKVLREKFIKN